MPSVCDAVTLDGKLFQTRGAATKNARSPIVERRNDGVTRADVDAERSRLLASMSDTRHSPFARYGRAVPCRQRNTSTASLNSIRSRTGNQWRSRSSGVMCIYIYECERQHPVIELLHQLQLNGITAPDSSITNGCHSRTFRLGLLFRVWPKRRMRLPCLLVWHSSQLTSSVLRRFCDSYRSFVRLSVCFYARKF